jgi:transposase
MRYELTDFEWVAIQPFLPNKPRGVPRVNDRRVLNGMFWVLRSGAPWRDLPENFGPYTTCYSRSRRTTSPSSSLRQSGYGCELMSSRPSQKRQLIVGPVDIVAGARQLCACTFNPLAGALPAPVFVV